VVPSAKSCLIKLIFALAAYRTKYALYAVTWRPDDEPPELFSLARVGTGIGRKTDNSMAKLLIII
jgi:hypothetical protein